MSKQKNTQIEIVNTNDYKMLCAALKAPQTKDPMSFTQLVENAKLAADTIKNLLDEIKNLQDDIEDQTLIQREGIDKLICSNLHRSELETDISMLQATNKKLQMALYSITRVDEARSDKDGALIHAKNIAKSALSDVTN